LLGSDGGGRQREEMAQIMYTHVNKCINKKKRKSFNMFKLLRLFFFSVLVFELRASCLLGMPSTIRAIPPILFVLVIFEMGSHFFDQPAYTMIILLICD
jgi:hypothetical protein